MLEIGEVLSLSWCCEKTGNSGTFNYCQAVPDPGELIRT